LSNLRSNLLIAMKMM